MNKICNLNIQKSNWKLCSLSDIATEISVRVDKPAKSNYRHFVGLEHFQSGELKIKQFTDTENLTSSAKAFQKGDILFARRNAYLKRASMVDFDGCCSGDAFVLREIKEKVAPGFLALILNSKKLWEYANSKAAGTMSKRVKWNDLAQYQFYLPNIKEQSDIAEMIWSLNDALESQIELLLSMELLRDTCRERLFAQGLDAINSKVPKNLKIGKTGWIRHDFVEERFFDCVEITSGQVDPKNEKYSGLYQIGSERIEPNTGVILELKTAKELNITSGNYLFTEKDIIYSKIRPYFKKVANPNFRGLCSADIYPLRPKLDNLDKDYLFYYLLTEKFTRKLLIFQNRTGMPKVNRDELGSIYIPLPPLCEQKQIVKILREIDQSIKMIKSKIELSNSLKHGLINNIF